MRVRSASLAVLSLCLTTVIGCSDRPPSPCGRVTGSARPDDPSCTPLIGAYRWDSWIAGLDFDKFSDGAFSVPGFYSPTWQSREPFYGWYNGGVPDHQAIIDDEINRAADGLLDFWAFMWCPEGRVALRDPRLAERAKIMGPFHDYLASPYKTRLRFALILDALAVTWQDEAQGTAADHRLWRGESVPFLVTQFGDAQYLKVNGNQPVLFWFRTPSLEASPRLQAEVQYLRDRTTAAGLGDLFIVDVNADFDKARAVGFRGSASYGPSGAGFFNPSYSGHRCYSDQAAKDRDNWETALDKGFVPVTGVTAHNDARPHADQDHTYPFWVDFPTFSEWTKHASESLEWLVTVNALASTSTVVPPLAVVYHWNELSEGGSGIVPTRQEGTKFLEGIKAARTGRWPATWEDVYNGDNCAVRRTGNWARYFPVPGPAYNNDDEDSITPGDSASLTAENATRFKVQGITGPDRGAMEVLVDGVSRGIIDVHAPTWTIAKTLYESPVLPAGTHTLTVVNRSATPGSSGIGIDCIVVSKVRP